MTPEDQELTPNDFPEELLEKRQPPPITPEDFSPEKRRDPFIPTQEEIDALKEQVSEISDHFRYIENALALNFNKLQAHPYPDLPDEFALEFITTCEGIQQVIETCIEELKELEKFKVN